MKKSLLWIVVLVVIVSMISVFLLVGCKKTEGVAETTVAETTVAETSVVETSVAETTVAETKPIVVSVYVSDSPAVKLAAQAYEKETGKKVVVEEYAREVIQEKVRTELTSKTGYVDVILVASENIAELAEGGLLEPLDSYMANSKLRQPDQNDWASPGAAKAYEYKDKLYGFATTLDTLLLYYRTDLIQKPPETWDEFLKIAIEQTNNKRFGTTLYGKLPESISWDFINYFWGFGANLMDENFHPTVNSPEGVAALTFFTDLLNKYHVVPPGVPTYEFPEVTAAFQQDKAAMVLHWNAAYPTFADKEQSPLIYDKFAISVAPGFKKADGTISHRAMGHVWGFAINASSKNKENAYEFLVYLTGKEGLKFFPDNALAKNVNSIAVLSDPETVKNHPEFALMQEPMKYLELWPNTLATPGLILALAQEASAALAKTKTPKQAMDDANAAIDQLMKDAGYY